jgi:hypothetical protein
MKSQNEDIVKWVATWQNAHAALLRIKRTELQAADYYEQNQALLNDMLWYAYNHRTERQTSGLVEQQHFFRQLRSSKT